LLVYVLLVCLFVCLLVCLLTCCLFVCLFVCMIICLLTYRFSIYFYSEVFSPVFVSIIDLRHDLSYFFGSSGLPDILDSLLGIECWWLPVTDALMPHWGSESGLTAQHSLLSGVHRTTPVVISGAHKVVSESDKLFRGVGSAVTWTFREAGLVPLCTTWEHLVLGFHPVLWLQLRVEACWKTVLYAVAIGTDDILSGGIYLGALRLIFSS